MLKSLAKIQRPLVEFDPENIEHRRYYKKFLQTNAWRHCPYQWQIDDYSVDVVHYINKKLIEYYIKNDTELIAKKKQSTKPKKATL